MVKSLLYTRNLLGKFSSWTSHIICYVRCKIAGESLSKLHKTPEISPKSTKQTESVRGRNILFCINICEQRGPGKQRKLQNHNIICYFKHDIKVTNCLVFFLLEHYHI